MADAARPGTPVVDLPLYAGRWIAVVRDRVAGVGRTAKEAHALAKAARPKEEPLVSFVPIDYRSHDDKMTR